MKHFEAFAGRQARIDGIVAAIIGLSRAMVQEPVERSVYETRGMLEFEF